MIRKTINILDGILNRASRLFMVMANLCLLLMLIGTSATILLRPLNIGIYWIWPWTIVLFVWMVFIGIFPIYYQKKDITIEIFVDWMGVRARNITRFFSPLVIIFVAGTMVWYAPSVLVSQVGPFEGAALPWGDEIERFYLTSPLFVSFAFLIIVSICDLLKAIIGDPELQKSYLLDIEG